MTSRAFARRPHRGEWIHPLHPAANMRFCAERHGGLTVVHLGAPGRRRPLVSFKSRGQHGWWCPKCHPLGCPACRGLFFDGWAFQEVVGGGGWDAAQPGWREPGGGRPARSGDRMVNKRAAGRSLRDEWRALRRRPVVQRGGP